MTRIRLVGKPHIRLHVTRSSPHNGQPALMWQGYVSYVIAGVMGVQHFYTGWMQSARNACKAVESDLT